METKINRPSFDKTVGVLVKAYLNNTLVHGNCYACAVGNIIAANMNYKFVRCKDEPSRKVVWDVAGGNYDSDLLMWYTFMGFCKKNLPPEVVMQISSTGYSFKEIELIEHAFERCDRDKSEEQYMFNGLMAVVDVLADIHGVDLSIKEQAKKLFLKTV